MRRFGIGLIILCALSGALRSSRTDKVFLIPATPIFLPLNYT